MAFLKYWGCIGGKPAKNIQELRMQVRTIWTWPIRLVRELAGVFCWRSVETRRALYSLQKLTTMEKFTGFQGHARVAILFFIPMMLFAFPKYLVKPCAPCRTRVTFVVSKPDRYSSVRFGMNLAQSSHAPKTVSEKNPPAKHQKNVVTLPRQLWSKFSQETHEFPLVHELMGENPRQSCYLTKIPRQAALTAGVEKIVHTEVGKKKNKARVRQINQQRPRIVT